MVVMKKGLQFGTRHVQCLMLFLYTVASFCIRGHLSVAIVAMTQKSSFNDVQVMAWDSQTRGIIQSSFYWSYIFLLVPAGQMSEKFGPKILLVSTMMLCGLALLLTPLAAMCGGFYWMIILRMIIGGTQAFFYPLVYVLLSKWIPTEEKGLLFGCIFSGVDLGTIIVMTMAGALADSPWGWPSIFYAFGGISILWAILFAFVGANSPQEHTTISEYEREYILNSTPGSSKEKNKLKTPWMAMLTSTPLFAVLVAQCAGSWAFYTLLFQAPSYVNAVLGLNMTQSGLLSALPYLLSLIAVNIYAMMHHWFIKKQMLSLIALLKLWTTIGFWGASIPLCLLMFAGRNVTLVPTLVILAVVINSAERLGFASNHLYLSPNFAGTLISITTMIATLGSMGSPLYVGFIVTDPKSVSSWNIVFLTTVIVLVVGGVIYLIFASAEVQPWNSPSDKVIPSPEDAVAKNETVEDKGEDQKV